MGRLQHRLQSRQYEEQVPEKCLTRIIAWVFLPLTNNYFEAYEHERFSRSWFRDSSKAEMLVLNA